MSRPVRPAATPLPADAAHEFARGCCRMSEVVSELEPYYEESQSIYDVSNDFFALFLDPTMGYTCAYFEREDMSLEEAQQAKFDLALGKLDLKPGMTLLDVGCGWGGALRRAVEKFDVNVIGITLSRNQCAVQPGAAGGVADVTFLRGPVAGLGGVRRTRRPDRVDRRLRGVQGRALPAVLRKGPQHRCPTTAACCCTPSWRTRRSSSSRHGIKLTISDLKFMRFIGDRDLPGRPAARGGGHRDAGRRVRASRSSRTHLLQPHYARTLDMWAENLEANRDQAIALPPKRSTTGT